jgi:hemoglobin
MSRQAVAARLNSPEAHAHAAAARERKREAAVAIGIDEALISALVETFYARIRKDELLGPIFDQRICDWPAHLNRMKSFWRSVLHNSGEFAGNPMLKHKLIPGLEGHHFSHWLDLFYETLRELDSHPEATQLIGSRARMIADSLLTGIELERQGLGGARAGKELPHV